MGNTNTREFREKKAQYEQDKEKRYLEWSVDNQIQLYDKCLELARYHFVDTFILNVKQAEDVTPLKEAMLCENIQTIKFSFENNKISSCDILPGLLHLITVDINLKNTLIRTLHPLSIALSQAQLLESLTLDASHTQIDSLKQLQCNAKLRELKLYMNDTQLFSIDTFVNNMGKSINMEYLTLNFDNTQISDLSEFATSLRSFKRLIIFHLSVQNTQIHSIFDLVSGLSHLSNLRQISMNLNGTQVEDIECLAQAIRTIPGLEYFNLKIFNTKVQSIEPLCNQLGFSASLISLTIETDLDLTPLRRTLDSLQLLEYLKITTTNIDPTVLYQISQNIELKSLILKFKHTDAFHQLQLHQLVNLKHLHLILDDNQTMKNINLASLSKIANLRTFQLSLVNTQIEEVIGLQEEIAQIKNFHTVELDFTNSKVPKDVVDAISTQLLSNKKKYQQFHIIQ